MSKAVKACGRIFNRHKWHYLDRASRVCEKCGESQEELFMSAGPNPHFFWTKTTFDHLQEEIAKRFQRESIEEKAERESRRKALEWMGGK